MDTRHKLLSAPDAVALALSLRDEGRTLKVAVGYFDPLLAAHARRLQEARERGATLAVIVADPPDPILPARARAELVAALEAVDYVVIPGDEPPEEFVAKLEGSVVLRDEATDQKLAENLIRHVHSRQSAR